MGLSTETYIQQFKTFDKYCSECFPDETELNEKVVLGWLRTDIQGVNVLNHRASFIRMFGKYLASIGKQAYILSDKFVPPQKHYTPYILSDDELKRLFDVIDSYPQNGRLDPLQPALFSTIFRLIYTCGCVQVKREHYVVKTSILIPVKSPLKKPKSIKTELLLCPMI